MEIKRQFILVIKPKMPVKNWLKNVFISIQELPSKIMNIDNSTFEKDATIYLFPSRIDSIIQIKELIKKEAKKMFEYELERFITDKNHWPKERSYELFSDWFNFEIHSRLVVIK